MRWEDDFLLKTPRRGGSPGGWGRGGAMGQEGVCGNLGGGGGAKFFFFFSGPKFPPSRPFRRQLLVMRYHRVS